VGTHPDDVIGPRGCATAIGLGVERVGVVVEDVVNGFRSARSTYAGCDRYVFDARVTAASSASSSAVTPEAFPLDAI
jgi:hypothetical protein